MDGPFRGYVADLVDLLHCSGEGAHHRGDGHVHALAHRDLVLIGVAEVEGQLQLLVVDQGGHHGALGHVLVDLELLHVLELTRKGGPDRQVGGILLEVRQVLVEVLHLLLGGLHRVLSGLAEDGVEGLARRDGLAGSDEHLLHGAAGVEGDGGGLLGLGGAAAGHLALDGAEEGGLGEDLPLLAAGAEQESVECKAAGRQQGEHNGQNDQVFDHLFLFPAAVGLDRRPRSRLCGCGRGLGGLRCGDLWHFKFLLRFLPGRHKVRCEPVQHVHYMPRAAGWQLHKNYNFLRLS